jgi:hypothetical protein
MKKTLFVVLILFIFSNISFAQFDDLFKKKKLPGVPDWTPGGAVTTSIKDAYPVVPWLGNFDNWEPDSITDFNLGPGYYRAEIQTYCLHAGTYAPTEGSGYLLAPLLGNQKNQISSILKRSELHPEIAQHDIQLLLWGIEAGTKFTDYPADFQARVKPLLTTEEIAKMSVDLTPAFNLVPSELKDAANMYSDMRKRLVDPASNYQDIEQVAIRSGVPPGLGPGSKVVNPGNWAYMKDGFYVRTFPYSYPHTMIEIYRPSHVNAERDNLKRVTALEDEGYRIEIVYDDDPGRDVLSTSGNPDVPIWRFKSIKLKGPEGGQEMVLDNFPGWIVKDKGLPLNKGGSETYTTIFYDGDPGYGEYQGRMNSGKQAIKDFDQYQKERNMQQLKDKQDEYWEDYHTMEGLKAATNPLDKKGQMNWIEKTLKKVQDWWNQSSDALAGGDGTKNNNPKKFDPTNYVSAPGNTSMQRLATSNRKFGQ